MQGICAFCCQHSRLLESHVIPAFAFRWLRNRSGTGHIRNTENPNVRVQDGLKLHWLCANCESRFNRYETEFATKVFYPWHEGNERISYNEFLLKFCVSLSWRVLKFSRGRSENAQYTNEQFKLMDESELVWRKFLQDDLPHPGKFEQHLIIFDLIESTNIKNLPVNFNRFMNGAITFDIVGSSQSLLTFAKIGQFIIFGIIQRGPNRWVGTKVHVKNGILQPGSFTVPIGLIDLFKEKSKYQFESFSRISDKQKRKIDTHIKDNLEEFAKSEQFKAIEADRKMFGDAATIWSEASDND